MFAGFVRAERVGTTLAAFAVLALANFALVGAPARAAEPAAAPSAVRLFGSGENVNADISPFPKWTGLLARYESEQRLEDAPCNGGRCALQEWKAFVVSLRGQDRMRQLQAVNAYVNRVPYQSDQQHYGAVDYWATPREFFGRSGDCEDYAIAKYLSLRKLGWGAHELRLVVLQDEDRKELHAVLVAYIGGTAYVLDNLVPDVREHASVRNYRPIFSINEAAWHFHREWNPASVVMVAKAEPERAPGGQARTLPPATKTAATQIAGPVPPDIDTARPRHADQPPLARLAARSYADNGGESLAELFSNATGVR